MHTLISAYLGREKMTDIVPWRGKKLTRLRREIVSLFDRFFEGWPFRGMGRERRWAPSVDVCGSPKECFVATCRVCLERAGSWELVGEFHASV
jgi:hypothetical protein